MYYKITNKESEVYKQLHSMRSEELEMEELNKKLIQNAIGLEYNRFLGYKGQTNFNRITQYDGFEFINPDEVDEKIWNRHKVHKEIFVPNRKTKAGKDMAKFLKQTCSGTWFEKPLDILGVKWGSGTFKFPFVDIIGEVILVHLDDICDPKSEDVIEITRKEFYDIWNSVNKQSDEL